VRSHRHRAKMPFELPIHRMRAVSLKTVPWCFSTLPSSLGLLVGRHGGGPGAVFPHVGRTALRCDAPWGPPPALEAIVRLAGAICTLSCHRLCERYATIADVQHGREGQPWASSPSLDGTLPRVRPHQGRSAATQRPRSLWHGTGTPRGQAQLHSSDVVWTAREPGCRVSRGTIGGLRLGQGRIGTAPGQVMSRRDGDRHVGVPMTFGARHETGLRVSGTSTSHGQSWRRWPCVSLYALLL
jgi:hypothetical protein